MEYWVLDIPNKQHIVHRDPANGLYADKTFDASEEVCPLAAPGECLSIDRL